MSHAVMQSLQYLWANLIHTWRFGTGELPKYFSDLCQGYWWGFSQVLRLFLLRRGSVGRVQELHKVFFLLCRMVCQNLFEASRKSFSMASPNSPTSEFLLLWQQTPQPSWPPSTCQANASLEWMSCRWFWLKGQLSKGQMSCCLFIYFQKWVLPRNSSRDLSISNDRTVTKTWMRHHQPPVFCNCLQQAVKTSLILLAEVSS